MTAHGENSVALDISRIREIYRNFGKRIEIVTEVVSFEPYRQVVTRTVEGGLPHTGRMSYAAEGEGTRLSYRGEGGGGIISLVP